MDQKSSEIKKSFASAKKTFCHLTKLFLLLFFSLIFCFLPAPDSYGESPPGDCPPPSGQIQITPFSLYAPAEVSFGYSGFSPYYYWNFGDGSSPDFSPNPVHIYNSPGTYSVSLDVEPAPGCPSVILTQSLTINPPATPPTYTLTVTKTGSGTGSFSVSSGSLSCSGDTCTATYDQYTSVDLSALPDANSTFAGWSGGICSGTDTCFFMMGADITVSAQFDHTIYTINATAGSGGTISPSGSVTVLAGDTQTFNITINPGYYLTDLTLDDNSIKDQLVNDQFSLTDIQSNHSITASFEKSSIPFTGLETNHQGSAAWNTDGTGAEAAKIGHYIPFPYDYCMAGDIRISELVAYYYMASRDYGGIDPQSQGALQFTTPVQGFPNLTAKLANMGSTVSGILKDTTDANGTIQLLGTFTSFNFTAYYPQNPGYDGIAIQIGTDVGAQMIFTDWQSVDVANNMATGTLGSASVTLSGGLVPEGITDGSFTRFNQSFFSPMLETSDAIYIGGDDPAYSYTVRFSMPIENPVIHMESLASTLTFSDALIIKLSGEDTFKVNGPKFSDFKIKFDLTSLGNDVEGQDWSLINGLETRYYTGQGQFVIQFQGQDLVGGPMPRMTTFTKYNTDNCFDDELSGHTDYVMLQNKYTGIDPALQELASAFLRDAANTGLKATFDSLQPAIQREFTANGRSGAYLEAQTGRLELSPIFVDPVAFDFGNIEIASPSEPQTFTITNNGTSDITLGLIALGGANADEFAIQNDSCSGQTLAPLTMCTIESLLSPLSVGVKEAILFIPFNDPDPTSLSVPLSGTGIITIADDTPPTSQIGFPANGAILALTSLTITGTADDGSGIGVEKVEVSLDGGNNWNTATGKGIWSYAWTIPQDGIYTIITRATDTAGNVETPGSGLTITIDHTAPIDTVKINNGSAYTTNGSVTLNLTCNDLSGCAWVKLSSDGTTWSEPIAYASSLPWILPAGQGVNTAYVQIQDSAGNWSQVYTDTIFYDLDPNNTTILSKPSNPSYNTNAAFTFISVEPGSTFQCQLDGGDFLACASPVGYADLAAGSHTFSVKGTSPGGYTDPTPASYTWTISTTPPNQAVSYVTGVDDGGHIYVVDSYGDGTFGNYRYIWYLGNMGYNFRAITMGDANNDGYLDIIVPYSYGYQHYFVLFLNDGQGNFHKSEVVGIVPTDWQNDTSMDISSGDFNNDGNLDFIGTSDSGKLGIFLGDGSGHFTLKTLMDLPASNSRGIDVADFNEDGNQDFAWIHYGSGVIYIFLGDGTGNFATGVNVYSFGWYADPYGLTAGDFDNDGHMDLLVNHGGDGDTYFFRGNGDGTFAAPVYVPSIDINNHGSFDAYDYNGDGNIDVVIANYSWQGLWYYPGNGDGTFGAGVQLNLDASGNVSYTYNYILAISAPPLPSLPGSPVAVIGADKVTANPGDTVGFNSIGSGDDSLIVNYAWDFGDGSPIQEGDTLTSLSHVYNLEGIFNARLIVTDNTNKKGYASVKITVNGDVPVAKAGGPYTFTEADATLGKWLVTLDGSSSTDTGGIVRYEWDFSSGGFLKDFNDGSDAGWGKEEGTWSVAGGPDDSLWYIQSDPNVGRSRNILTTQVPENYIVETDVVMTDGWGEEVQLLFDAVDVYNNFEFILRGRGYNDLLLARRQNDSWSSLGEIDLPFAPVKNTIYHLKVEVKGENVKAYLNKDLIFDLMVKRFPAGKVGLSTYYMASSFDNLRVTTIPEVTFQPTMLHLFPGLGTFPVTLTVFDKTGQSGSDSTTATITQGNPPVANAGGPYSLTESQVSNGGWTITLDGSASSDDTGIIRYAWELGANIFAGTIFDSTKWLYSGNISQQDALIISSGAWNWGTNYAFSKENYSRVAGTSMQARVKQVSGYNVHTMIGFKNTTDSNSYGAMPYAIYFANGDLRIYQDGSDMGHFASYSFDTWYDIKIELKAPSGARYYFRASTDLDWIILYDTDYDSNPELKRGADVYNGTFIIDNLNIMAEGVNPTVRVFGSSNVTLTVFDRALQSDSKTTTLTITGATPVANPGNNVTLGESDGPNGHWLVNFDGTASTDDSGIWLYQWDFGDGTTGEGQTISHTYDNVGSYTVTLTVTDYLMQTGSNNLTVTITPATPPTAITGANLNLDEHQAANGQWVVNFDGGASTDDTGIWRYQWDFGDGTSGEGLQVSHTYNKIGNYTVTLTVTDNAWQTGTAAQAITIGANDPPVANAGGPYTKTMADAVNGGWTVDLNGSTSTDDVGLIRYIWDLGIDTFQGSAFNKNKWSFNGNLYQYDALSITGRSSWEADYVFSKEIYPRANGMFLEAKVKQISGYAHAMIGFKNTSDSNSYTAMPYTLYFADGDLRIYEDGSDRGHFANYSFDTWYDIRIELKEPSGARYYYRQSGDGNWILLYDTEYGSNAEMKRGATIHSSTFIIDDVKEVAVGERPTVRIYRTAADIKLTVEDNAHQLNTSSTTFTISDSQNPVASAGGSYFARDGLPLVLDGGQSMAANPIVSYKWELENGTALYGKKVMQKFYQHNIYYPISATASSEYTSGSWSAMQAIGEPDVAGCGDNGYAWTTSSLEMGEQWLELTYAKKIMATRILIHETYNVGFVTRVDFFDSNDTPITVWTGTDTTAACPGWFEADLTTPMETQKVRVYVNSDIPGWNEIDTVALVSSAGVGQQLVKLTVTDTYGGTHSDTVVVTISPEPTVVAVPWQFHGGLEVPHDTWSGKEVLLKAVVYDSSPVTLTYTWDFGDGSTPVSGTVSDPYALEALHIYTGAEGTLFTGTITVTDSEGNSHSDTYPVKIQAQNLDTEKNLAIDDGLWWLHKNQYRNPGNYSHGSWSYGGYSASPAASAIQAFEINGHLEGGNIMTDPYVETIWNGMDYLFRGGVSPANIGMHTLGNPDGNHNGLGIQASSDRSPYETGMVIDALVASQTPAEEVRGGNVNFIARSYRDIVQDMVDMYSAGMSHWQTWFTRNGVSTYDYIGGWRYSWNSDIDNSAAQWAAIGMIPAEKNWGITIPEWVKTANDNWLWYSFSSDGFGYSGPGTGDATRPSGMVQMVMDGMHNLDPMDPRWVASEGYYTNPDNWNYFINSSGNNYAWYAFTKAMRLGGKGEILSNGFNWFRGDDSSESTWGIAKRLIERQNSSGTRGMWPDYYGTVFGSSWSIIMLTPTLFELGPVADAGGNKVWGSGQPLTFNASASRHLDPNKRIVSYDWNFGDGTQAHSTSWTATHTYIVPDNELPKSFTVTLTVKDNGDSLTPPEPVLQATTSIQVLIVEPPHAPVAVISAPTKAVKGVPVRLDGSGSFDIDNIAGDYITLFEWAEGDNMNFDPNKGTVISGDKATASVVNWTFATTGPHTIHLRVWDNGSMNDLNNNGTVDPEEKLSGTSSISIEVIQNLAPVAILDPGYTVFQGSFLELDGRRSMDPDGSAIGAYLWDFNGGDQFTDATGPTARHVWNLPGTYLIKLKVVDSVDPALLGITSATVNVLNVPPQVNAGSNQVIFGNLAVNVKGQYYDPSGGPDSDYTFKWSFGDGGTANTLQASHTYQSYGSYTVTLEVTDKNGGTGSSSLLVNLVSNPLSVALPGNTQVSLDWSAYKPEPAGLARYYIYQSQSPFGSVLGMNPVQTVNAGTFQTVINNLTNNTTYYFAVVSVDGAGAFNPQAVSSAVTPKEIDEIPPAKVTGLTAKVLPGLFVQLDWIPSASPDTASYYIFWDNGTGTIDYGAILDTISHPQSSWISQALTQGTTYKFGVRAIDQAGNPELNTDFVTIVMDYPDLKVSVVNAPSEANYDAAISFTLAVTNQGNVEATAPFSVGLYVNDQLKQSWPVTTVAAGQTLNLTVDWKVTVNSSTTPYNVKFMIDADNAVVESDETNNESAVQTLLVKRIYFLDARVEPVFALQGQPIKLSAGAKSSDDLGLVLSDQGADPVTVNAFLWSAGSIFGDPLVLTYAAQNSLFEYALDTNNLWGSFEMSFKLYDANKQVLVETKRFKFAVGASDYYVDVNSGSDIQGDGSRSRPWKTITFSLSQIFSPAGNLHVLPGTYSSSSGEIYPISMIPQVNLLGLVSLPGEVESSPMEVIIEGQPDRDVIIFPGSLLFDINTRLANLTIRGGAVGVHLPSNSNAGPIIVNNNIANNGIGILCESYGDCSPEINGNAIQNNSQSGIKISATLDNISGLSAPLIVGNHIKANGHGIVVEVQGNLNINKEIQLELKDNIIEGNSGNGVVATNAGGAWQSNPWIILLAKNNLLTYNGAAAFSLINNGGEVSSLHQNDTMVGNGTGIQSIGATPQISNSILWDNQVELDGVNSDQISYSDIGGGLFTGVNGNVSVDPRFVDAASGDYHLAANSSLVDAGTNQGIVSTDTDLQGLPRMKDGNNDQQAVTDLGAFEVQFYVSAGGDRFAYQGQVVSFIASVAGNPSDYLFFWDFGDGTSSSLQNPSHIYQAGNYRLVLSVTDNNGVEVIDTAGITVTFALKGDLNGDMVVDLTDAILGLQVLSGFNPAGIRTNYPISGADVNDDNKIDLPEVIYILQKIIEMR